MINKIRTDLEEIEFNDRILIPLKSILLRKYGEFKK